MARSNRMLTQQLGHIISSALREQPLVVLPGFGGFVKDHIGAELDEMRNRVHPPKNSVIFNAKLSHNDGLLVAAIASELELTYSAADKWLTDAVSEVRFRLNNGDSVLLDGIGELKRTLEGNIEFKAVALPEIQDDFFGLKPVSLNRVEKDNVDKVRELVASDGTIATKVRTLPVKRITGYAAAAAAIGLLVWMPIQQGIVGNGKMLVNQLNPFAVTTEAAYQSRQFDENWLNKGFEKEDVLADKFQHEFLELHLAKNAANAIVVKTDAVPSSEVNFPTEEVIETVDENATSFKVVAATFASRNEAADYVANMIKRGFAAEYAGKDAQGHMVAYGTYDSLKDAEKMLASVSLSNKQARIVSGN